MGVTPKFFDFLVSDGQLPEGVLLGHRRKYWHWMDLVAWSHMRKRKAGEPEKKPSKT